MDLPVELEESLLWRLPQLGVHRLAVLQQPRDPQSRELVAWLPVSDWREEDLQALGQCLQPLGLPFAIPLPPLRWRKVADEDWSLSWKQHWAPDPIGQRLLVLPAWMEEPPDVGGRQVIRLDPGPAFGTGSHPSTRLCLEGLEGLAEARVSAGAAPDKPLAGLRVADLGCGSGLLGLAALALGAEKVYAVDTDPLAVRSTEHNTALNGFSGLTAALGSCEELERLLGDELADVLLCNILAPVIAELSKHFSRLLVPGGRALLSGLLVSQSEDLLAILRTRGWTARLVAIQEPWALLSLGSAANVT